jgi:Secretion system C-terminal sorting domain
MKPSFRFFLFASCLFALADAAHSQWIQTNGPMDIRINCFAVSPTNGTSNPNIFAGTNSGIYLSTNDGTNWTAMNNGLNYQVINSLLISGANIYAGTYGGVFLSTNNGSTWSNIGLTNEAVSSLAINDTNIFVGTWSGGIFLSTNNGASWQADTTGLNDYWINALAVSGTNIFAGSSSGVFLSTNNGVNWTAVNNGLTYNVGSSTYTCSSTCLAVNDTNIFAGTTNGLYLSTNNGTSWNAVNTGLNDNNKYVQSFVVSENKIFACTANFYFIILGQISYWQDGGVYLSTNNGLSWSKQMSNSIRTLAVSGNDILAGGTDGGVFLSKDDGSNWSVINNGFPQANVTALAISGTNIFAGTYTNGINLSTNNGTSWAAITDYYPSFYPTGFSVTAMATLDSSVFVSVYQTSNSVNHAGAHSTNNGARWIGEDPYVQSYASSDTGLYGVLSWGGGGLFHRNNYDSTWMRVPAAQNIMLRNCIAASGSNLLLGSDGVYLSTDYGASWSLIGLSDQYVSSIAISGTRIYAATNTDNTTPLTYSVYMSPDMGESWQIDTTGLTQNTINAFAVVGTNVFAGGTGVYLSAVDGKSWTNTGLQNMSVNSLTESKTNLYAGTTSGVWTIPLSELITDVKAKQNNFPTDYSLYQNYPNPFNPSTNISFNLPSKSFVKLKIFDLLGREVATIVSEEMSAGNHTRQWNAANMSSGVYFCRLEAGSFSQTKKLVLLR